ncbi:unnamed protein product [Mytilus coruscus]|uniref:Uncharacterized protein n=1 Tax=Mytilus coruscus TaxID=42192 RepID=A0A6J8DP41_MYTCO|nr:unnamed protein product [Mytilus coruscus]
MIFCNVTIAPRRNLLLCSRKGAFTSRPQKTKQSSEILKFDLKKNFQQGRRYLCDSAQEEPLDKSEMSDRQFDVEFDDMVVDQEYKIEEMFSQSARKEQARESNTEIKRKNERIIELELMLEEKQDWFNLKSQMVKKLEGELNHVHARHPERFTFDDTGTSLVPKSLEQTLKDLEREEREETFRAKYMPVYHREIEALTWLDDLKVVYSIENLSMTKNSLYDEDGGWKSMTAINIAYELKFDRQVNFDENQMTKKSGDTPTKSGIKTNESAENNWWPDRDSFNMWRTRPQLARPNKPRQTDDKKQGDHPKVKELINGNNISTIDDSRINKKLSIETFEECVLKKSVSMESVFEGDDTKMRHSFIWRMGDECVSLEKYIHVYTKNPEELYEAVKKRAIEEELEEDYEENVLYAEEIKASHIGIDKTKIKSNLRILDNIIREEEEKAKSALKQVHTEDVDEVSDDTLDEKIRAEEEKIVMPPGQTGGFYEDIDGTDKVGYEEKINTSFEIIFEKPKKRMFKPKLSSEKRKTVNLMPNVNDQNMIKSNENKEDVKLEEKKNISFDIIFEKPKKRMLNPNSPRKKEKPSI